VNAPATPGLPVFQAHDAGFDAALADV
jgi:hypothetical protein